MASAEIAVEVVIDHGPHRVECRRLTLPLGATAADAVQASGLTPAATGSEPADMAIGCWGRLCAPGMLLREGDRIELYRPLQVEPMQARRARYQRDGLRKKTKPPKRGAGAS